MEAVALHGYPRFPLKRARSGAIAAARAQTLGGESRQGHRAGARLYEGPALIHRSRAGLLAARLQPPRASMRSAIASNQSASMNRPAPRNLRAYARSSSDVRLAHHGPRREPCRTDAGAPRIPARHEQGLSSDWRRTSSSGTDLPTCRPIARGCRPSRIYLPTDLRSLRSTPDRLAHPPPKPPEHPQVDSASVFGCSGPRRIELRIHLMRCAPPNNRLGYRHSDAPEYPG